MAELFGGRKVVQVVRTGRRGQALGEGFRDTWTKSGHPAPVEIALAEGEPLTGARLGEIVAREKPAALLVWDDATCLGPLETLVGSPDRPGVVLTSGTYLGKALWSVPEALREMLYFTYPYRLPQDDARFDITVSKVLAGRRDAEVDPRILRQSFITQEVLGKALMEMRGEYYRDFLLDTVGMMTDLYLPLYERVSFGPGQRYASKGCYIVQLAKGEEPQLERRSEWVTR
jgi:hypothetical protein